MKGLCSNCKKYATCKELCAQAVKYVEHGYKETRELPVGNIRYLNYDEMWPDIPYKSEERLVYEMHFIDKMEPEDISFHITMSISDIKTVIQRLISNLPTDVTRKKNLILRLHFIDGLSLTKTAKVVGVSKPYAHEVIKDYLEDNNIT